MPKHGQQKGTPARRAEFLERLRAMGEGAWCVMWPWSDVRGRYAYIHVEGVKVLAHRWVYEQVNDMSLPKGSRGCPVDLVVMHTCDNRPCVRPSHLRLGSQEDNIRDAAAKGHMRGRSVGEFTGSRRKLSDYDVSMIRELRRQGVVQTRLARAYNVSDATISLVVNNRKRVARESV